MDILKTIDSDTVEIGMFIFFFLSCFVSFIRIVVSFILLARLLTSRTSARSSVSSHYRHYTDKRLTSSNTFSMINYERSDC